MKPTDEQLREVFRYPGDEGSPAVGIADKLLDAAKLIRDAMPEDTAVQVLRDLAEVMATVRIYFLQQENRV